MITGLLQLDAQVLKQTIRGVVIDKALLRPIEGVKITIDNDTIWTALTDSLGQFEIIDVTVGRHKVLAQSERYFDAYLPDVLLNSGKELVLNIQLEERIKEFSSFKFKAKVNKIKPINDFSVVSSRTFSVEETQKFAAAINDPARMATSFAGVIGAEDGNNTIVIRGNSPSGMLWRMEGIDIPGPNHFSSFNGSGGGISILSAQLLGNSDFMTGAFPAEYGNALSGVFDLRLRKGNSKKREYTLQAGFLGLDLATEGPLSKKGGSYLVNYRYSTLGLIQKLGVNITGSTTLFQDLSYNIVFPNSRFGSFSVFGFGGISNQLQNAVKDSSQWKTMFDRYNVIYTTNTAASGLTHTISLGKNTTLRNVLLYSINTIKDRGEYYENDYINTYTHWRNALNNQKLALNSTVNHKLNSNVHLRAGLILNHWIYSAENKELDSLKKLVTRLDNKGLTNYAQAFAQFKLKLNSRFQVFAGLHSMYLQLNKTYSIEPRLSAKYEFKPKHTVSIGYGLHSQLQMPAIYFAEYKNQSGQSVFPNKNLGMSKAHHIVAAYEFIINSNSRLKLEAYYQDLFKIPVSQDPSSTYSLLNNNFGPVVLPLENTGNGKNVGIELTAERFLNKGFYYLISASVYNSQYKTKTGQWYNTRFNGNHAVSVTAGKEIKLKGDRRILGFNFKTLWYGGFRETPIDLEKSRIYNIAIEDQSKTFSVQLSDYFRTDIKVSYRINHKKYNSIWSLDIQNATNRKNVGGQYFDLDTETTKTWYQAPLIPVFSYKIEF
ncbi:MAG: TonB-dependent receptor [Bacteroidia bacterium]|nr:TonB-dependent receptor [Bacteroidia bacterium]